jgi:glutamate racemase
MNARQAPLHRPLGIFDAGIGSYAIVQLVQKRFPDQDIIYLADRASFPYGAKDKSSLQRAVISAISRLRDLGADAVLVASNAPTITVLKDIKQLLDGPLLGVTPPVTQAIAASKTKSVGVLGVKSLIESNELKQYIAAENTCGANVATFNASPLVGLVESGAFLNKPLATIEIVRSFVSSILIAHSDIDVFTLSSTHLPWLKEPLEAVFPELLFLDPAEDAVSALAPHVTRGSGQVSCVVTASEKYPFEEFREMLATLKIPLIAQLIQ